MWICGKKLTEARDISQCDHFTINESGKEINVYILQNYRSRNREMLQEKKEWIIG